MATFLAVKMIRPFQPHSNSTISFKITCRCVVRSFAFMYSPKLYLLVLQYISLQKYFDPCNHTVIPQFFSDNVEVLTGPLPSCIPQSCICSDGSEKPLPSLPKRILKKIKKVLEKITAKIASKLTKVCDNGESPR